MEFKCSNIKICGKTSNKQENEKKYITNLYDQPKEVIKFYNGYISMIFNTGYHETHGKRHKILTPKKMLYRLSIALAQVKVGNTSKNLLNEIRKIIYSLHRVKQISKKSYNNIINSIKV